MLQMLYMLLAPPPQGTLPGAAWGVLGDLGPSDFFHHGVPDFINCPPPLGCRVCLQLRTQVGSEIRDVKAVSYLDCR